MVKICRFFLKGTCKKGSQCPFKHEFPKVDDSSQESSYSKNNNRRDNRRNNNTEKSNNKFSPTTKCDSKITIRFKHALSFKKCKLFRKNFYYNLSIKFLIFFVQLN